MSEVSFHLPNGNMKVKMNPSGSPFTKSARAPLGPPNRRKKKKKTKKTKKTKDPDHERSGFLIDNISLADPDAEYPSSRVIKLNPNGELVVESLDDEYPPEQTEENQNAFPDLQTLVKLSPKPDSILFRYEEEVAFWNGLTDEEKADILSVSYEELENYFKEEMKVHGGNQLHAADCNEEIDCEGCAKDLVYINDEVRKEIEPHLDYLIKSTWFMQDEGTTVEYFDPKDDILPMVVRSSISLGLVKSLTETSPKNTEKSSPSGLSKLPHRSDEQEHKFLISDWEHKAFCDSMAFVRSNHTRQRSDMSIYESFPSEICSNCFPETKHTVNELNFSSFEKTLLMAERIQSVALFKSSQLFQTYKYKKEYFREISPCVRFQLARSKLKEILPSFPFNELEEHMPEIRKMLLRLYCLDENIYPVHELNGSIWLLRGDFEPHFKIKDILTGEELLEDYIRFPDYSKAQEVTNEGETSDDMMKAKPHNYCAQHEKMPGGMPEQASEKADDEEQANVSGEEEVSDHESCEKDCTHEHQSNYSDEESIEELDAEAVATSERFSELLGLFFIQSTQYVRGRFLDAFNKKNCDFRTQEFIKELQAEEDAKKEKQLKKELQKEKQREQRLAQQKLKEAEKKKKELKELEKAKLIEKQKDEQRAEQLRQRELASLKKDQEKMKRIEALRNKESLEKKNSVSAEAASNRDKEESQKTSEKSRNIESPKKHTEADKARATVPDKQSAVPENPATIPEKPTSVSEKLLHSLETSGTPVENELSSRPLKPNDKFATAFNNQNPEMEESQLPIINTEYMPPQDNANQEQVISTEDPVSRNHLLDQLYHARPKSLSFSPEHSPSPSASAQLSESPAFGLNFTEQKFTEHRQPLRSDIWSPLRTSVSSDSVAAYDKLQMSSNFGPPQDLKQWIQTDSLLSNSSTVHPTLNEARSRSIWANEITSPGRSNWRSQTINSQINQNSSIWNSSPTFRPMHTQSSLNYGSTQSIQDAAYNAIQNLKVTGVAPSGVAPTMQVFQAAKSILGTPSLGLSEFLKSLSSNTRFELIYDDTGSVSHIKENTTMGGLNDAPTQNQFFGLTPNPPGVQYDAQTQLCLPQLAHQMNAYGQERAMSIHNDGSIGFQNGSMSNQSIQLGASIHPDGQSRSRFGSLATGTSGAMGMPRDGIW